MCYSALLALGLEVKCSRLTGELLGVSSRKAMDSTHRLFCLSRELTERLFPFRLEVD